MLMIPRGADTLARRHLEEAMRRLAAVMAADMVGYTALMRRSEAAALGRLRSLREQFFEPIVTGYEGEIIKRLGDGWIVSFASIVGAVQAAMAVQTGLARQSDAELRIGLHLGDLLVYEDDWYGDCINFAARLQSKADPGSVLVSANFMGFVDAKTADQFESVGLLDLKGVNTPIEGFSWRPPREALALVSGVPRLRIKEPMVQPSDDEEVCLLAEDMLASIEFRLSRRTGVRLVRGAEESDYVLESRVRRSGKRLRASMSLGWTSAGERVWQVSIDGSMEDPLDWIDRATERADLDLRYQINALDSRRLKDLDPECLDVHGLLTLAAGRFYETTEESFETATELCRRALEQAPDNSMALAMTAEGEITLAWMRGKRIEGPTAAKIRQMAERAVQQAPESDYAQMVLSLFHSGISGDFAAAAVSAARSLEISPNYCYAHYAAALAALGEERVDDALEAAGRAVTTGASEGNYLPLFLYLRSVIEVLTDRLEDAERSAAEALSRAPRVGTFLRLRRSILKRLGREEALPEARNAGVSEAPTALAALPPLPPRLQARLDGILDG